MAPGAWVSPQDAAAARELREALRTALETAGRDTAELDAAASRLPLVALPGEDGRLALVSARGGADDVRAAVIEAMLTAQADGSWPRLKVCRNPDCRWAFADRSKNRSRAWCEMATCGSRSKMRAYRARREPVLRTPESPARRPGRGGTGCRPACPAGRRPSARCHPAPHMTPWPL